MVKRAALNSESVQRLSAYARRLQTVRKMVWIFLPIGLLVAAADGVHAFVKGKEPLGSLKPSLEELNRPLAEIPPLNFPEALFQPVELKTASGIAAVVPLANFELKWKLKGISMAGVKRAFVEKEGQSGVWIQEGDLLEAGAVKEIRERSVVIEVEGKPYEIRM